MTLVVVISVSLLIGIELARWALRPEARRLRVIKKIRGRR